MQCLAEITQHDHASNHLREFVRMLPMQLLDRTVQLAPQHPNRQRPRGMQTCRQHPHLCLQSHHPILGVSEFVPQVVQFFMQVHSRNLYA